MKTQAENWKIKLKADPTAWLLEQDTPPIRYQALVDILDRPRNDPDVRAAQQAIAAFPPVASLLSAQAEDGHWGSPDYYLPRAGLGTFWVLTLLGDLGLSNDDIHVQRGCDFMFAHQRQDGAFCRRRHVPGQGRVWQEHTEPCTQARILRFLIQFGYSDDARVRNAIQWLLPAQRDDGMWFCRSNGRFGCLRATLDVLRVATLVPEVAVLPAIRQAAQVICTLLMEPRMSRYHVGEKWGTWECLKYPYFGFSLLSALDVLARLGFTSAQPKVARALDYLLSRQDDDGTWPLDDSWPDSPIDFGRVGAANKWITLDAMRVIKRLTSPLPS